MPFFAFASRGRLRADTKIYEFISAGELYKRIISERQESIISHLLQFCIRCDVLFSLRFRFIIISFHFSLFLFFFSFLGAFLVPYMLMVFVIGLPIFFAELFVGQYSGLGPLKAYQYLAPFFHGKHKHVWVGGELKLINIEIKQPNCIAKGVKMKSICVANVVKQVFVTVYSGSSRTHTIKWTEEFTSSKKTYENIYLVVIHSNNFVRLFFLLLASFMQWPSSYMRFVGNVWRPKENEKKSERREIWVSRRQKESEVKNGGKNATITKAN